MSMQLHSDLDDKRTGLPYLLAYDMKAERMYCTEFAVVGSGKFPTDMLRRDMCHPVDESEANSINADYDAPRRIVRLRTWSHNKFWRPTYDRWLSMGWSVVTAGDDAQKVWPNGEVGR